MTDPTTDDRGKAALAEALHERVCERMYEPPSHAPGHHGYNCDPAAILGDRGVFWPTGTEEYRELIHQYQAEIARYRTALTSITNMADRDSRGSAIERARAALAPPLDDIHGTPTFSD